MAVDCPVKPDLHTRGATSFAVTHGLHQGAVYMSTCASGLTGRSRLAGGGHRSNTFHIQSQLHRFTQALSKTGYTSTVVTFKLRINHL